MQSNAYAFKIYLALDISKIAITRFNRDTKLFQAVINAATPQASLLLKALPTVQHTHF